MLIILAIPVILISGIVILITLLTLSDNSFTQISQGGKPFSEMVLQWEDAVREEAIKNEIPHLVNVLLAIIQVETGGNAQRWPDIFQASESQGLPPNTIDCPYESIRVGVSYFANAYHSNPDHDLLNIIQGFNYGFGFLNHTGYEYQFESAVAFARRMSGGRRVTYTNPIAIEINGGWRYQYGNMFYAKIVQQYLQPGGQVIGDGQFAFPIGGNWTVTSPFGNRANPFTGALEFHSGMDMINDIPNAPIYAIADGTVIFSGWDGGYGNRVVIQHDSTTFSGYAHNQSNLVRVGDRVTTGQQIAIMGTTGASTGVHLHFSIMMNTTNFRSGHVNPAPLIGIGN